MYIGLQAAIACQDGETAALYQPSGLPAAHHEHHDIGKGMPVSDVCGCLQAAIAFKGGETAALQRLKHYLWDTGCISEYFNTRNGMLGADYSTKFSPWLAHGCISPRTIHHEVSAAPGKYYSALVLALICRL